MRKTRLPIPAGLAELPPGPELAAVLAGIDLSRLGGLDCVTVMQAQHRQAAHEQAKLMAAMVEVALCGLGPDDALSRMDAPDEFSADEIRGALVWTRAAATTQLSLAWDLRCRLPQVFAALERGAIDVPKAKVFSEWTCGLTDAQAQRICDALVPQAPELTTGQLTVQIKRLAIAIDPDWARRRYAEAVRERKVVGYRNDDGTANLCGYQLPVERAAAACAHLDALAKKIKHAGDGRAIDLIRADLYLAILDGSYTGWPEHDIIAHMLATAQQGGADPEADADADVAQPRPDGRHRQAPEQAPGSVPESSPIGADSWRSERPGPIRELDEEIVDGPDGQRPVRRAGVEIRVEITTLLGIDDHPGEIAGWGFTDAEAVRELVRDQTAAEWRYAITDDDGYLKYEGITRRRPHGYPPRAAAPCRGGIVELHIKHRDLRKLAASPHRLGRWATIIADLARQAEQPEQPSACPTQGKTRRESAASGSQIRQRPGGNDERGPRIPGKPMRRRTEIRDRTCTHPRCRTPAYATDGDHIQQWARGGATKDDNIASACRHDHRLKHDGGWQVAKLASGQLVWISRLGIHYHVPPPLIIQPLPDPAPREPVFSHQPDFYGDGPIWRESSSAPSDEPGRSPPPHPNEPIPF